MYVRIEKSVFTHANEDGAGATETLKALLATYTLKAARRQDEERSKEAVGWQSVDCSKLARSLSNVKSHYLHNNSYENIKLNFKRCIANKYYENTNSKIGIAAIAYSSQFRLRTFFYTLNKVYKVGDSEK